MTRFTVRTWQWPLVGLAGGLTWGVAARAWMRYVSEVPEFSWEGTLFIVGVTGLAGLALGSVEALRRMGCRGWRRLLALPALLMFASPGMLMAPSALFGAVALSGRGGRWVRVPAGALAVAPAATFLLDDESFPHSSTVSLGWYALLCLALAAGWLPVVLLAGCTPEQRGAVPLPSPSPAFAPVPPAGPAAEHPALPAAPAP